MNLLILNVGSSSIKYDVFKTQGHDCATTAQSGCFETPHQGPWTWQHQGMLQPFAEHSMSHAIQNLFEHIPELDAVVHRIVHGGTDFIAPVRINKDTLKRLKPLESLAPEHNPKQFQCIEYALNYYPKLQHIACFDTGFHQTIPSVAHTYAIPQQWRDTLGIRRFGFHGLSHAYVSERTAQALNQSSINAISCHLGNGASICAIRQGHSIDTSMGYTPLDGLVMGTRSGHIDPSLIQAVHHQTQLPYHEIFKTLNTQSGLLGLCGDSDLRAIMQRADQADLCAQHALDIFCYRIKHYIGAYYALLGPIDAMIFTGGIGEHSPYIRQQSTHALSHLGLTLDQALNKKTLKVEDVIDLTDQSSKVKIYAVHTDESKYMAQLAWRHVLNR